mmetsp:Transcript_15558/g.19923  ORF Transcript_15558/g.19923 Transcript_15558/m.19923 type:complete len:243 (-) Transcript_15558:152-880(-)
MSITKPFVDRYVHYTYDLFYADKILKLLGYGIGTIAGGGESLLQQNSKLWSGTKSLSDQISMARVAYRLTNGIPQSLEAIKNNSWVGGKWYDRRINKIYKAMAWSNLFYHIGEHWAWAGTYAPEIVKLPGGDARFWAVTCYWWLLYVLLDIYGCLLKLKELNAREQRFLKGLKIDPSNEEYKMELNTIKASKRAIYWQLVRLALYLPNAYHWALEHGCLPRTLVQFFGMAEAVVGILVSFPR